MKIIKTGLSFCLLVCLTGGCVNVKAPHDLKNSIHNNSMILTNTYIFYAENGKWPNSIEELRGFCSKKQGECAPIDWNKFTCVSFRTLPDGRLKIEVTQSKEHIKSRFSTVLDAPRR